MGKHKMERALKMKEVGDGNKTMSFKTLPFCLAQGRADELSSRSSDERGPLMGTGAGMVAERNASPLSYTAVRNQHQQKEA